MLLGGGCLFSFTLWSIPAKTTSVSIKIDWIVLSSPLPSSTTHTVPHLPLPRRRPDPRVRQGAGLRRLEGGRQDP